MEYAIDEKKVLALDGASIHLRVRSNDPTRPVLLFLHGGPGVCDRHWVLKDQSALTDTVTMLCYDQRGAGLSYRKGMQEQELSVDRMVEDAAAVAKWACERFGQDKVFVVGHSWGSLLGVLLAKKYPELVRAYIGMGQFVNGEENEALSYDFVLAQAQRRADKKALRDLARIGEPVRGRYKSMDDMMIQRNLMTKYGGGTYKGKESLMRSMILPLLRTPEYSLTQLKQYSEGAFFSLRALWDEVVDHDLFQVAPSLAVPVYLTEGRHDQNTPIPIARRWFESLEAPHKEWIWFEESAHSPIKEEPEKWGETVRRIVRENCENAQEG